MKKKEFVAKETEEQKNARWKSQMKFAKSFAKCSMTKNERADKTAERSKNEAEKLRYSY